MINVKEQLLSGKSFEYEKVYLTSDGLFDYKDNKISEVIYVKSRSINVQSGKGFVTLCFDVNQGFQEITISTEDFEEKKLKNLAKYGVLIQTAYKQVVTDYLIEQYQELVPTLKYTQIGFLPESKFNNEANLVFGLSKPYSQGSTKLTWDEENSDFDLTVAGAIKKWQKMVKKHVIPSAKLTLALGLGLSSIIIGYKSKIGKPLDSPIFHLMGRSSTGKTTAGRLAISVWGSPENKDKGLFQSWNATANSLIRRLGNNNGVSILLDETSMSEISNFTSMIYRIAQGKDKGRSESNGTQQERASWATTLITTGESSVLEQSNKNAGLFVRMQEFSDIQWTESADQSNEILEVVSSNYGKAGLKFVQYLARDWNQIQLAYNKWFQHLHQELPDSPYRPRVAERYAAVMAGLDLFQEPLNLQFDLQKVMELIVQQENKLAFERDIANTVYQAVLADVQVSFNSFIYKDYVPLGNCKGKILEQKDYLEVAYFEKPFKELIKPFATNLTTVESALKGKDFYLTEKDRNNKRLKNEQGVRTSAYAFKCPENLELPL